MEVKSHTKRACPDFTRTGPLQAQLYKNFFFLQIQTLPATISTLAAITSA